MLIYNFFFLIFKQRFRCFRFTYIPQRSIDLGLTVVILKALQASQISQLIYPVLVFFHGGNFQTGSANEWPGEVLASRGIVVVTVNYRLGAFGFMSLGDDVTGNYGLQVSALKLATLKCSNLELYC